MIGHEIELRAGEALEFGGAARAGKVVADAKCISSELVDGRESLALVRAFSAGNAHALGLRPGIDRVSAAVRMFSDENFIFAVVQFETDGFQDVARHGLSGQLGLGGYPT